MKTINYFITAIVIVTFFSCGNSGPEQINLNKDDCDNCKMSISDNRFACELLTEKGRAYKFDDLSCMISFKGENKDKAMNARFYIANYLTPFQLIEAANLTYVEGENVGSPMGGNIAAFINKDSANAYIKNWDAKIVTWETISNE